MSSETRSIATLTPALNCSRFKTDAAKLTWAVRFRTVMSISPTLTEAFKKTSGGGSVVDTLAGGVVSSVAYTADAGSPLFCEGVSNVARVVRLRIDYGNNEEQQGKTVVQYCNHGAVRIKTGNRQQT